MVRADAVGAAVDVAATNIAFAYTHAPIDFYFKQSPRDFVVTEVPLYQFSGEGAHLIIKLRKKNLTTFELLKILSTNLGIKEQEIGYAGLKDKNALTIQHLSLPIKVKDKLESFSYENIKILETTRHNNKLKIGHLSGNQFFIRLKKLTPLNAEKISKVLENIANFGIPNYFSYQRFGADGSNYLEGKEIVEGRKKLRNKKIENFLLSAYQSHLFNAWLSFRIQISHIICTTNAKDLHKALELFLQESLKESPPLEFKDINFAKSLKEQEHFFKLFFGDVLCHYPHGRNFTLTKDDDLNAESKRFLARDIAPTGLLSGKKMESSKDLAFFFEKNFIDSRIKSNGQRRYAWIYPQDLSFNYKEEEAQGELCFYLPKGAYATNLLRELAHREIKED